MDGVDPSSKADCAYGVISLASPSHFSPTPFSLRVSCRDCVGTELQEPALLRGVHIYDLMLHDSNEEKKTKGRRILPIKKWRMSLYSAQSKVYIQTQLGTPLYTPIDTYLDLTVRSIL